MSDLKDALHDLAAQGPPLGDLAERAIRSARRRRAGHRLTLVAAVAAVTAVLLHVIPSGKIAEEPTFGQRTLRTIAFSDEEPKLLPPGPIGPVLLAYTVQCRSLKHGCGEWRLLTLSGQEFRVPDAIAAEVRNGTYEHDGVMSVASDGSWIAYFDTGGHFVVRDMRGGIVYRLFSVRLSVLAATTPHIAWSPDSQRVTVDFFAVNDDNPTKEPAVVVDLTTLTVTQLPGTCCVLGLPSGDAPIPMYDAYETSMGKGQMLLVGDQTIRHLPIGNVELATVFPLDPRWTAISADGRRFATLMWPQPPDGATLPRNQIPELTLIDADLATMSGHYPFPTGDQLLMPMLAGWRDPRTVLIALLSDRPGIYAIDTDTGETQQVVDFPAAPARLSVAAALL